MVAALLFLQYHSIKNRLWMRIKRLKQPKYLLGGIVGGLYFYFYFCRYLFGLPSRHQTLGFSGTPSDPGFFELLGALLLFVAVVAAWVLPNRRAALGFTEAEVAFLFPAPISRRGLIHYKLLRSQAAILFTTLLLLFVTNRFGGRTWIHAAGWWFILSIFNLHMLGSSFARTMLLDRGITNRQRRLVILAGMFALVLAVIFWVRLTLPGFDVSQFTDPASAKGFVQKALGSGAMGWLLYPFRWVVRPFLAPNAQSFLIVAWPALLLMAVHYVWVIRSNVAFEEASVEASQRLADKIAAVRAGNWRGASKKLKPKGAPFVLRPSGPALVALFWKNLIGAGQVFTARLWVILAIFACCAAFAVGQSSAGPNMAFGFGAIAGMFLVWSLLLGPQILRQDLRQDLLMADALKLYPLPGWQVVLGELLAPAAILTGVQWLLVVVSVALLYPARTPVLGDARSLVLSIGLGAVFLLPMLNLITLQIPNAAVLVFPAWFQTGKEAPQGIEATGQRIIFMIGQLLVLLLVLVPAAIGFTLPFFLLRLLIGTAFAIPVAALGAALVLAGEAVLGLMLLGRLFDRFDLSAEGRS